MNFISSDSVVKFFELISPYTVPSGYFQYNATMISSDWLHPRSMQNCRAEEQSPAVATAPWNHPALNPYPGYAGISSLLPFPAGVP